MTDIQIHISKNSSETILQQLIDSIQGLISESNLKEGDALPSINELCRQFSISRDTVFKAYQQLKISGLVDSTPAKGYFVARKFNKILLLLDYFSPFKDAFHEKFKQNIPKDYIVDLVFHHYNKNLFKTVIQNSAGKYSYYIVMNYDTSNFEVCEEMKLINPDKLLFIDIPVEDWKFMDKERFSYVFQDFEKSVYSCLEEFSDLLKKYKKLNIIHTSKLHHPDVTVTTIQQFCQKNNIKSRLFAKTELVRIKKGDAYFIFRQVDLGKIIKRCQQENLVLGEDVGIIAYNDFLLYEFVDKGISVISIDFEEMGKKAAEFVTKNQSIKEYIKAKIKIRGSL